MVSVLWAEDQELKQETDLPAKQDIVSQYSSEKPGLSQNTAPI